MVYQNSTGNLPPDEFEAVASPKKHRIAKMVTLLALTAVGVAGTKVLAAPFVAGQIKRYESSLVDAGYEKATRDRLVTSPTSAPVTPSPQPEQTVPIPTVSSQPLPKPTPKPVEKPKIVGPMADGVLKLGERDLPNAGIFDVSNLQRDLNDIGCKMPVDGVYSKPMEDIVKQFQFLHALFPADGEAGPITLKAVQQYATIGEHNACAYQAPANPNAPFLTSPSAVPRY